MTEHPPPHSLFIVSDGTGETAFRVVEACLKQFDGVPVRVEIHGSKRQPWQLAASFEEAAEVGAMVIATLVRAPVRQEAERLAQKHRVPYVDLIGSMLGTMSDHLRAAPQGMPGLMFATDQSYYKRIAAVEFTVKADDGKEPRMLTEADIVLVGVSRTSKTPLSIFLAHKGFKVGNVPLVLDREPPPTLWEVDPNRIFALTIDASKLKSIRAQRLEQMRMPGRTNYSQLDYILAELDYAQDLFSRNRDWPVIDVTDKAVEETAGIILGTLAKRGITATPGEAGQL
ncbi:MAG: kinase/pyrophosphorylase [Alphaproteobacteria bacterium]|nr:kinase/pyrophosphorylase [Alphaproteobacteria bacterium]